ncbi:hypothetical protein PCANC_23557 [Puccinia coronata f. sp. avenae]|uniref:Uncharacterized protein n=1 Tax=Puccinia coronata f. sp. avenae TaxID=200324 RepID=A0A2N5VMB8_9BASI|nr:hypothetical protein PCANC_23557 [Puccinia coronata f. sp. avenae]PLW10175.1 hypothetical protein PCASD_19888 [Puccinia coronata f. sp. avenae]PLW51144.1 hypothetical protein PCASD_02531 [Puccinia coronata f. sp. avenae]
MTIAMPSHPLSPPTFATSRPNAVGLIAESSRKKEFPSVAKLLDGLSFQDETHPDFLLRASSSRLKPNPIRLSSPTLYVRSPIDTPSTVTRPKTRAAPSYHPLSSRLNPLDPTTAPIPLPPPTPSPSLVPPPSSIPLLIERSSDSACTTTTTTSSTSSFSLTRPIGTQSFTAGALRTSLKRPYNSSEEEEEEEEEDDDDDDSQAEGSAGASDSDSPGHAAFGLGIDWQTELKHCTRAAAGYDRPTARPSLSWLRRKHAVDRSTSTITTITTATAAAAAAAAVHVTSVAGCLGEQKNKSENNPLIQLMASRSLEIRQVDKRRRYLDGTRFHQVIR